MIETTGLSLRALQALSRAQEITSNNLANLNTPGFRADEVYFHSLLAESGRNKVHMAEPHQIITNTAGRIEQTGNPLDVAIQGDGFFEIRSGDETFLTRSGRFQLNEDGYLVDAFGGKVQGYGGDIMIPVSANAEPGSSAADIVIAADGTVYRNEEIIDTLLIQNVGRPETLERHSNSWFTFNESSLVTELTMPNLFQGGFETSNVDALREMMDMMKHAQLFESMHRAYTTADETISKAISSLGRF